MLLYSLLIHQLSELMEQKEISSVELTEAYFERISQVENEIRAFITLVKEKALTQASEVDKKRALGEKLSPLAGIPMAMDDNICTEGVRTTCASKILGNFIPPYDATVAERLKSAGAILIGKCNMDEFGMGSSTENSAFYNTKNPYDSETVQNSFTGGSAVAVAADEVAFALGSDTGGYIRQSAASCGVIGLKPTYGYVSRFGLISYASSLDQIGPITKDILDLALVLNTICGQDVRDATSTSVEVPDFTKSLVNDVKGLRIGLPKEYFGADLEPEVAAKLQQAVIKLEELGAVCEEVSMPHAEYATPAHVIIAAAEASSNLARFDGVRHGTRVDADDVLSMFKKTRSQGFGTEVKRRIMLGTHVLSTANYDGYYVKALKVRNLVKQDFSRAFEKFDCLLTPIIRTTAFRKGAKIDPLSMYLADVCTSAVNLAGVPALSIPLGMVNEMPVGMQLIARHFGEDTLLKVGYTLEQSIDHTMPKPVLIP